MNDLTSSFLLLLLAASVLLPSEAVADEFEVHQWSVFLRTEMADGARAPLPPGAVQGLPSFVKQSDVLRMQQARNRQAAGKQAEVLTGRTFFHFHNSPSGVDVEISKDANLRYSHPTPKPGRGQVRWQVRNGQMVPMQMNPTKWELSFPGEKNPAPVNLDWWNALRKAGSDVVQSSPGSVEEFMMMEVELTGVPKGIRATFEEDGLRLRNENDVDSGPVLVVFRDGEDLYMFRQRNVKAKADAFLAREVAFSSKAKEVDVTRSVGEMVEIFGLTKREAKAISAVWEEVLVEGPPFLVISRALSKSLDQQFPVTIDPAPKSWVKMGLVIDLLFDQTGRMAWMPKTGEMIESALQQLDSDSFIERAKAFRILRPHAETLRGELEAMLKEGSPEVKARVQELMNQLGAAMPTQKPRVAAQAKAAVRVAPELEQAFRFQLREQQLNVRGGGVIELIEEIEEDE